MNYFGYRNGMMEDSTVMHGDGMMVGMAIVWMLFTLALLVIIVLGIITIIVLYGRYFTSKRSKDRKNK